MSKKSTQKGRGLMLQSKHSDRLPPKNALVKKSNQLVEASYDLSLHQLRLLHWLSRAVQEDDEDYKYYDIEVPLFLQFLQLKGSNSARDRIREVTRKLQEKTILIRHPDNPDEWEQFSLLRYSRIMRNGNCLTLRLSINPEMLPHIRDLKAAFTKTGFYQITAFKSRYGWRFYEWFKQFENTGWFEISVADMRKRLQIGETEYTRFNNFRQRVITPALSEINRVSDLNVELEKTIKRGRSVHALRFAISKKDMHIIPTPTDAEPDDKSLIVDCLVGHGMPRPEAQRNVEQYYKLDRDHLMHCVADVEQKIESGFAFKQTPLVWLRYILKNDQRKQSTLFVSSTNRPKADPEHLAMLDKQKRARERIEYLESVLADVKRHHERARRVAVSEALSAFSSEELDAFVQASLPQLEDFARSMVKPATFWNHPLSKAKVDEFLRSHDIKPLTYELYCQNSGVSPTEINSEIQLCNDVLTSEPLPKV